jgi:hypothetical protein
MCFEDLGEREGSGATASGVRVSGLSPLVPHRLTALLFDLAYIKTPEKGPLLRLTLAGQGFQMSGNPIYQESRLATLKPKGRTGCKSRYAPTIEKEYILRPASDSDYLPMRHTRPVCILRLF